MDLIIRSQDGKTVVRNPSCLDVGIPKGRGTLLWSDIVDFCVLARFDNDRESVLGTYRSEAEAKEVLEFIFRKLPEKGTLIYQMP